MIKVVFLLNLLVTLAVSQRLKDKVRGMKLEIDEMQRNMTIFSDELTSFRQSFESSCCLSNLRLMSSSSSVTSLLENGSRTRRLLALMKGFEDTKRYVKEGIISAVSEVNSFHAKIRSLGEEINHISTSVDMIKKETDSMRKERNQEVSVNVEHALDRCVERFETLNERINYLERKLDKAPDFAVGTVGEHTDSTKADNISTQPVCPMTCKLVNRSQWGARPHKDKLDPLKIPVGMVFIHDAGRHQCLTQDICTKTIKTFQNLHMDVLGFFDIGENFLIGGDGRVYEGRSWDNMGAHVLGWNQDSIGIAIIGKFSRELPGQKVLQAVKNLIKCGVDLGKIRPDYKLFSHRDVASVNCPGDRLHAEIQTWPRYDPHIEKIQND